MNSDLNEISCGCRVLLYQDSITTVNLTMWTAFLLLLQFCFPIMCKRLQCHSTIVETEKQVRSFSVSLNTFIIDGFIWILKREVFFFNASLLVIFESKRIINSGRCVKYMNVLLCCVHDTGLVSEKSNGYTCDWWHLIVNTEKCVFLNCCEPRLHKKVWIQLTCIN